jgi:hypothetical protein
MMMQAVNVAACRHFLPKAQVRIWQRELIVCSKVEISLRITLSVEDSAFFDDSRKFLLKLSNCSLVNLSIARLSCSVLALTLSVNEFSEIPLFGIHSPFEAQFFPALWVFDGDIVLASPVNFEADFAQGGKNILPIGYKALLHFFSQIGVDGFLGFGT